jgi:putative glycosyltransferase (TIGR04348 family)
MSRPRILIVSPASARDNNGNWQSASRWARFLRPGYRAQIASGWSAGDVVPDLLIALHARRSAPALAAFRAAHPQRPTLLVLTGTDVYRDIDHDASARASLELAHAIVVLQTDAVTRLPAGVQAKASVIHQSAPPLTPYAGPARRVREICMIGHLRPEKDPLTFMRAAGLINNASLLLTHIGGVLDATLGQAAEAAARDNPRYRWLGAQPRARTRQILKRSHAMAITSTMEGGANVIIEAVTCGVPVLASQVGGNVGMLGPDYAGYFVPGDAAALARLAERSVHDPGFHALLKRQCAARAPLFAPSAEQALLRDMVDNLLRQTTSPEESP